MKYFAIFLLSIILSSCYERERNCTEFKTGEFEFKHTINGVEKTSRFIRTDSIEIDFYENSVDTNSVRWINDCEFIVKKINPTSRRDAKAIHMKILTTDKDSYLFEYSVVGDKKNKQKGRATKVKSL
ncbi:hypothetical protein HX109_13680 [Galbibacter sp. BG1]|uniref:hypothetical protein n=1 Tax=Galbibacter sp. BG1 TaxID=1170699 RepID=UPI0015BBC101|nr:hypothetical protein [Galbibacter sp. BG1]QLE02559.1 hypothetical protein HX109_13680 [Galbibacter sp. BG1]